TAPWWATVLVRYGPAPLLAAFQSGQPPLFPSVLLLWVGRLLDPSMTLVGVLALLGFFVCLRDRQLFLPAWMLVILTLNVRQGHTYAAVAAAMLFAVALDRLVLPAFGGGRAPAGGGRSLLGAVLAVVVLLAIVPGALAAL